MGSIQPTHEQVAVLYVIVVYTIAIFALWCLPLFRVLINPLKLFTIGAHELCHVIAAIMSGGTILSITIDPNLGGCTRVMDGHPTIILCAGYIGSSLIGGLFILASWTILGSKIASFVIGFGMLAPVVLVRDLFTLMCIIFYEALLVGFWFIAHGAALRWYVLFFGVMNVLYVVWDLADDKFFKKQNTSDATQFEILYPELPTHLAAWLWILFQLGVFLCFIFIGLIAFKKTDDQLAHQASIFLPT
ncbi:peptidase M50B-like-domain-containing protein [Auriculariales sp. MPI-PUGE-AT-0066]|nr:peptidase M50B-like-domain-containing protein [Auriculariales sp. MPI-PUGE-AT-0066]